MRLLMIAAAVVAVANGQSDREPCPVVEPMPGFDMSKFLGIWNSIQETSDVRKCVTNNYTQSEKSNKYVLTQDLEINMEIGQRTRKFEYRIVNELSVPEPSIPALMQASFPESIVGGNSSFIVFETDYENYAGIVTCGSHDQPSVSILSRRKSLDKTNLNLLRLMLSAFGIDPNDLVNVVTPDCLAENNTDGYSNVV